MTRYLREAMGAVRISVRGADLPRFLNLCATAGIRFWDLERLDFDHIQLSVTIASFRRLPRIARKSMCRVHLEDRGGLPFFFSRLRPALIVGLLLFLALVWGASAFLWDITITGYDKVSPATIRTELAKNGIVEGVYAGNLDLATIKNQILIDLPELIYININRNGSHAEVTVRERTLPPPLVDRTGFSHIVAREGGIITSIVVQSGTQEAFPGDTVMPGQLLANGYMTGRNGITVPCRARADVRARTWEKTRAALPLTTLKKNAKQPGYTTYSLLLGARRIKIFQKGGIDHTECDKIIKTNRLTLPGGIFLPLALEITSASSCMGTEATFSVASALTHTSTWLARQINLAPDDDLIGCRYDAEVKNGAVWVGQIAECEKQIGAELRPVGSE